MRFCRFFRLPVRAAARVDRRVGLVPGLCAAWLAGGAPAWSQPTDAETAAAENPLSCRVDRAASKIACEVVAATASVRDATINGGACRPPRVVFEYQKHVIAAITGQDISSLKDFTGDYRRGDAFTLYADRGCAVYEYAITVGGRAWRFTAAP